MNAHAAATLHSAIVRGSVSREQGYQCNLCPCIQQQQPLVQFVCVLRAQMSGQQQQVFTWGAGEDGQLGLQQAPSPADEWHVAQPVPVPGLAGLGFRADTAAGSVHQALVGGSRQSLCVTAEGGLFTWGWNEKQALGLGHRNEVKTPQRVAMPAGVHVVQVRRGGAPLVGCPCCECLSDPATLSLFLTGCVGRLAWSCRDGLWGSIRLVRSLWALQESAWRTLNSALFFHRLLCRGGNENLQTGVTDTATQVVPTPSRTLTALRVRQVAAGGMHSLALTEGGDVWGWGQPLMTWGTSAVTNVYDKQRAPSRVEGAVNCVRIAAGAFHNLALTATGHVLSWGNSDYGQLGLGSTTHVSAPHVVRSHSRGPYVHEVVMIDATTHLSLFWSVQIEELSKAGVTALAAGGWHSAVVTAGGLVYIWGRGEHGRLGLGDIWKDRLRPVELPLAARATAVCCGGTHSCVLTEHGMLLTFGRQSFGRLGRSATTDPNVPGPVELPPPPAGCSWRVDAASAGGRHTLALATAVPLAQAVAQPVDDAPAALKAPAAVRGTLGTPGGSPSPILGTE